ncbi:PIR Superfamily Protein [Plasmodium ovale wallikeri]|uniref:PIR Superfamily Protein n=1 Tax=Plasmodium ovale wallikeri TaxID=864142 RepID=A0A1A9AHP0_PLAOA|nr:PIR Superfamily Protein [Plasmodium ovale wallikeri]SBT58347.1 PIR Superfamily Protein [Plasmodium ovale wallikeri]
MAVEVSFSEKSQNKTCMDEYFDIDPVIEKKVDDVDKTDENEDTFLEKCNGLRKYLESYNDKYKHCFDDEASYYFFHNRSLMNTALIRCTDYEKRLEELKRTQQAQVNKADEPGEPHAEEEDSTKAALLGEKKIETSADCTDATCKSKELEDQKDPQREGSNSDESESKVELNTLETSQGLTLSNSPLSSSQVQSGNEDHSSTFHTTEGTSLNNVPNINSKVDETGNTKTLLTDSPGTSDTEFVPLRSPSSSSATIRESPDDRVNHIDPTPKGYVTGAPLSQSSVKQSSPGQSADVGEVAPINPILSTEEFPTIGSFLTPADGESNSLSLPSGVSSFHEQPALSGSLSSEGQSSDSVQIPPAPQPLPHSQSEEIPIKTYIIIILVILAIIMLSILLFKVK